MNKSRKRLWIQLSLLVLAIFISVSLYFFMLLFEHSSYIGISARQDKTGWVIKKIQVNGAANVSSVKIGDKIERIDGYSAKDNQVLNKWLVVEQADHIVISRAGRMLKYN